MSAERVEISKYPNRRYYDRSRSRHVTLEEIRGLVRDGKDVVVTDSKSGDDITHRVMAQIILDLDADKLGLFPLPLLTQMIRTNEHWIKAFMEQYLNQLLGAFLQIQNQFQGKGAPNDPFAAIPSPWDIWSQPMRSAFPQWFPGAPNEPAVDRADPRAPPPPAPGPDSSPADPPSEMDDLKDMIQALRRKIEAMETPPAKKRRSPAARRKKAPDS